MTPDEPIKPALSDDEINLLWRAVPESPGYHEIDWNQEEIAAADAAIAKVKLLTHGFTQADVDLIKAAAECCRVDDHYIARELNERDDGQREERLAARYESLASRIAALLPAPPGPSEEPPK